MEEVLWGSIVVLAEVEEGTEDTAVHRGRLTLRTPGLGGYDGWYSLQEIYLLEDKVGVDVARHLGVEQLFQVPDLVFYTLK